MAQPKKALPNQPPPPKPEEEEEDSSGEEEEEEEESSREEEGGEEEEESDVEEKKEEPKNRPNQTFEVNKKPTIVEKQATLPPPPQSPSDSSESEEGSSSEEELEESPHSPSASDFTIKAIIPKKPILKDSKPTSKRPSETPKSDEKELRSNKKTKVSEEELKKEKSLAVSAPASGGVGAGRVWSEEDEIRVLHGMIDYQRKTGADVDMVAFHEFVKGKLQAEVTKTQLYEKVRRLKQKYFKNVEKSEKGEKGEDLVFNKPHEAKSFDLSKRIWGSGVISDGVEEKVNVNGKSDGGKVKKSGKVGSFVGSAKNNEKIKKKNIVEEEVEDDDGGDFEEKYPFTSLAYSSMGSLITADQISFLKSNMSVIESATSREFEERWKKVREEEAEILLKKLYLLTDHTKRVLDGIRKE